MNPTQRPPAQEEDNPGGQVVTERAGRVAWRLAQGERLSNRDVQQLTGLGQSGAWLLMGRLSRVLPVVFYSGVWRSVTDAMIAADGFEGDPPQR